MSWQQQLFGASVSRYDFSVVPTLWKVIFLNAPKKYVRIKIENNKFNIKLRLLALYYSQKKTANKVIIKLIVYGGITNRLISVLIHFLTWNGVVLNCNKSQIMALPKQLYDRLAFFHIIAYVLSLKAVWYEQS